MVNSGTNAERQVAVLIDFENVGLNAIQWLFDQISDIGRVTVKRAYADWSVARSVRDQLLQLGIEPIHLFHSGASAKNSSDIRLVIDAVDLLYQAHVDTFVIVSSDSDFVPLVSKLRAAGKSVIGAGRQATVSRSLVISCDRYFYLDQRDKPVVSRRAPASPPQNTLLLRAMTAAMDEQGSAVGSRLRQTLQRLDPSFDFRALGHSTFSRYLEASPEVKVVRPSGGGGDVNVELADPNSGMEGGPVAEERAAPDPSEWAPRVDAAWAGRAANAGDAIPGPSAASAAADILGVSKLSASSYKTLQRLLDASPQLASRWYRSGNSVLRK